MTAQNTKMLATYIAQAQDAALAGGKAILEVYDSEFEVSFKEDASPLTLADQKAHQAITEILEPLGLPILSEEGKNIPFEQRKDWELFWMVDPLDGTKEFVKRNGEFTVNIALIEQGKPIWGIVYAPVLGIAYWGGLQFGAFQAKNLTRQSLVSDLAERCNPIQGKAEASPYMIVGSRSHSSPETEEYIKTLSESHGKLEFISMGSSLKICLVAEGAAQQYPRFAPTMEWDTAAGHAVAIAANCSFIHAKDFKELSYNKENLLNPWFIVKSN